MAAPGGGMGGPGGRASFLTDEEKANRPKVTKALLGRIVGYLKPYWLQFLGVFVAIVIAAIVGLAPSIITGKIVDQALVGDDLRYLIELLLIALAAMLVSQVIGVLENYINAWISQRIVFDMKNQMYDHLQHMPHSFFATEKQGDIITRMNTDISGVSSVISGTLSQAVSNIATVVTTLVALFSMSWQLAIVGVAVVPLLIFPTRSAGRTRLKLLQETQAKNDEMNQMINETLSVSGSLLVKMFTREKAEYERFRTVNEEATQLAMRETRSGSWFNVVMGMFTQIGPLLIYFAGGLLIIKHLDPTLTVGTVTAMVTLVNRLYRPVESLMNLSVSFTRSLAMFTRIFDYLDRENTIVSPENGQKPDVEKQPITYEHVAFSYDGETMVLTDIDFTVPGGSMYAIVGPSGSGKSTTVNFIPRLYDVTSGAVRIAGVDVRDFDLTYLRQCIGVVTQETYLFNGTILENLRYAKPDATQEEVEEACRIACIHDFIVSQPDGYDTQVGNRGLKLSGGEKQRLSLARVVLKDPKILVLDEATSALDSISEDAIQSALETLMAGRTSIVIAHRLSTILKADCILVVKDGVIAEQGTHDELLERGGVYRDLYETQFRRVIDYERGQTADSGLEIQAFSTQYDVRRITEADITDVYLLAKANRRFYEALHTRPTVEGLTEVISNLPEGAGAEGKHFVGFYAEEGAGGAGAVGGSEAGDLVAIMDLICGYPGEQDVFIGWFMVDADLQGQGIGSGIFADVRAALSAQGYTRVSLQCPQEHPEAVAFWQAQGFTTVGDVITSGEYPVIEMERAL